MIKELRAKPVKKKEIKNNIFDLKPNNPKQIDVNNNSHIAHIYELKESENVDEHLYIHSEFTDDASAMIGNEFYLNFLENSKKVDMSYYYFSSDKKVTVYLYDMKKTFAGIETIIHLIEQWKGSIADSKSCIEQLEGYKLLKIQIGVITENDDSERRKYEIESVLNKAKHKENENIPSFMVHQRHADNVNNMVKAKMLNGFIDGKITICGCTYSYDVREFTNKRHDMWFKDGFLKA